MIPLFTLDRQHEGLRKEIDAAIDAVIERNVFILGPEVAAFEQEFADYLGIKHAIGVASGTDALSLSLLAAGVGPGDEVILPANSYPSVFAITAIGAIPKLVDIDPATFLIDTKEMVKHITNKTKAIIAVHIYGNPVQIEDIRKVVKRYSHKIVVIEDCAQACGAEIRITNHESRITNQGVEIKNSRNSQLVIRNSRKVGTIGDVGCFSFYPTKNIGAMGDGGMVVTNDPDIAKRVKLLRMYGEEGRYKSVILGRNSRLDEMQAAILRVKLGHLDQWNGRRREIAAKYTEKLPATRLASRAKRASYQLPAENESGKHVYHLYVVRCRERDKLKAYLEEKGIGSSIHYPVPIHLVPSMKYLGYKPGYFPETERACAEILSLPMFSELTDEEVGKVTEELSSFLMENE